MAWGKAGSTTLSTAGDSVDIGTITASKTMNTMFHVINNGNTTDGTLRFNNNSSANYPSRWCNNGGSENTATNHTYTLAGYWGSEDTFGINYICNVSGEEKLSIMYAVAKGSAGVGNAPNRREAVGKFTETTGQITDVEGFNEQAGSFDTNTNLTVLGCDMTPQINSPAVPAIPALMPSLPSGSVGGWVEVGRTTLGSAGSTISIDSLADKRYYMMLSDFQSPSGGELPYFRAGNGSYDSGSNYAMRYSADGGSDTTTTSNSNAHFRGAGMGTNDHFDVTYIANLSAKEKLGQWWNVGRNTAGASNAPIRDEGVFKHVFTSNPYDQIQRLTLSSETYAENSEVIVLGWDPSDTHTTNFWEELASVELSSANANISSGTISAKKYLWIQAWFNCGSANDIRITFNSDSGNNYSHRMQQNGGSDVTYTSQDDLRVNYSTTASPTFVNLFMVNNASNEKLITGHMTNSGGSGASSAPDRRIEFAGKWTNTSDQITSMNFYRGAGLNDYNSGTILKVWGSD